MTTLFLKHWPKLVAILAVLAAIYAVYAKGVSDTEAAQAVKDLKALESQQVTEQSAYAADAEKANAAINRLRALNVQIEGLNEYLKTSPTSGGKCLDGADTDQLRNLWK